MREDCQLAIVLQDLVAVEHLIDDFVVGSLMLEEWIIHVTVASRVDPQHIAAALALYNGLTYVVLVFQVGGLLERVQERRVFDRVVIDEAIDGLLHLVARLSAVDIAAAKRGEAAVRRDACALDATAQVVGLLSLIVEALHSMLDLVEGLLLAIEALHAHQVERIAHEVRLDGHVERRVAGEGRRQVDLKEPGLQVRVDQDVEAQDLKAVGAMGTVLLHRILHVVFTAQDRLDDDIIAT